LKEGEYGINIMYSRMKMENIPIETIPGVEGKGDKGER
jgi:hypothetical protein